MDIERQKMQTIIYRLIQKVAIFEEQLYTKSKYTVDNIEKVHDISYRFIKKQKV